MHRPSITNPDAISDLSISVPYIRLDRCNIDTIGEWAVPTPSYLCGIIIILSLTIMHSHIINILSLSDLQVMGPKA